MSLPFGKFLRRTMKKFNDDPEYKDKAEAAYEELDAAKD